MAVRILKDEDGYSCMYCSTSMWAFGGIFYKEENIEDFLNWLSPTDPRRLTDHELETKIQEWREYSKIIVS